MAAKRHSVFNNVRRLLARAYSLRTVVIAAACLIVVAPQLARHLPSLDTWLYNAAWSVNKNTPIKPADDVPLAQRLMPGLAPSPVFFLDPYLAPAKWDAASQIETNAFRVAPGLETPPWFFLAEKALILICMLLLVAALPRMTWPAGFFTVAVFVVSLAVIQIGMQVAQSRWLPLGVSIQFLVAGYLVMAFWLKQQKQIEALREARQDVSLRLGKMQLKQGMLEETLTTLRPCLSREDACAIVYDVAVQQEKKRQYDAAANTYLSIAAANPKFRDAAERAKKLAKFETMQQAGDTEWAATQTLATPADISRPVLGRYEIVRELGRGAMGVVYLGRDPKISRQVAVKTLNYRQFDSHRLADLKARFFREAEAAGRLDHPNIVTVYDVGEEADLAFIAMDYIQGKSLNAYAKPGRLLPVEVVYMLMAKVAEALEYAHQKNIVHRDIKPANIIFNPDNQQVKVTDFGIARISDKSKTRTGQMLGSPLYMSPEQLKGGKVNGVSDIFSLGVTFYQLLTGEPPFNADSLPELTQQILNKKHRSVRELRPELPASAVRITNKALQKDPAKRYANAGEMAEQLRRCCMNEFGKTALC
ncbi:serine/threonine-protein kinase [Hahella sp. HN01]|uniref:serine/threonine-protein kinase n=1 Tax=Hahella sp. HN01 TaxID=2847262 RepID=UPI001C1EC5F6|nr:serine/threonine protein kinase [Hahella sp. HN01]